jgi:hypothetical protein
MASESMMPEETAPVGRVHYLMHKGQPILLVDYTHCTPQQVIEVADRVQTEIAKQPANSVLALADYTGAQVDKAAATRIQEALVFDRPKVKRSAWVGTEDLPNAFYEKFKNFSQRDFPKFATREEAMEWLVSDD